MNREKYTPLILLLMVLCKLSYAQYAPQAPLPGHDAIAANDSNIVGWAINCVLVRGWINIADTSLGKATFGNEQSVIGQASSSLLSLGDGGIATLTFEYSIKNGEGSDFAVFENGFSDPLNDTMAFLELAFVEVSSDGENFFRFSASCHIQDTLQLDNFTYSDARQINNLAGKYKNGFGTPFDLEELKDEPGLDINNITHIRIIDVVGSLDSAYASFDANGKIINDPYPTEFASGGFDLNAIAVLHDNRPEDPSNITETNVLNSTKVYPNPVSNSLFVTTDTNEHLHFLLTDIYGKILQQGNFFKQTAISTGQYSSGFYYLQIIGPATSATYKILKQ